MNQSVITLFEIAATLFWVNYAFLGHAQTQRKIGLLAKMLLVLQSLCNIAAPFSD